MNQMIRNAVESGSHVSLVSLSSPQAPHMTPDNQQAASLQSKPPFRYQSGIKKTVNNHGRSTYCNRHTRCKPAAHMPARTSTRTCNRHIDCASLPHALHPRPATAATGLHAVAAGYAAPPQQSNHTQMLGPRQALNFNPTATRLGPRATSVDTPHT